MREEIVELKRQRVDDFEVKAGLATFEPVWESLSVAEQSRLLDLLVEKVVYDGSESTIAVTFSPPSLDPSVWPKRLLGSSRARGHGDLPA